MDLIWADTDANRDRVRRAPADVFALPSRAAAIVALRPALEAQAGPVLVTGEAGVGKTWLWRRLLAEMPPPWRWLVVDIPPEVDPEGFYRLIGHSLGLPAPTSADRARLALSDFLRESTADGTRWVLVLEEAHNAPAALLEEVRILANRLGLPDGFSALILVGQTSLARQLALRPLKPLAARLAAHVHLRCLDVEEARALLNCLAPDLDWDDRVMEERHRDTRGNPRTILHAAQERAGSKSAIRENRRSPSRKLGSDLAFAPQGGGGAAAPAVWQSPLIGPSKPPLHVGDGMIEVGWEPSTEPEPPATPSVTPVSARDSGPTSLPEVQAERRVGAESVAPPVTEPELAFEPEAATVETINDHYAALQAWNEWARNQGRGAAATNQDALPYRLDPSGAGSAGDVPAGSGPASTGQTSIWREGQQGFAPYGQLFSRLRQIRDVNESS
jgi:general secretion pathway protein A